MTSAPSITESLSQAHNPLLEDWVGPFGGVPPFDQVRIEHFEPALLAAMEEYRQQLQHIVAESADPTFENTLRAFEDAGRRLKRVQIIYGVWDATQSDKAFQAVARKMAPLLAAFDDEVVQNRKLFARIASVEQAWKKEFPSTGSFEAEQKRLSHCHYTRFVLAGAQLDTAKKAELTTINQRLASLFTHFSENVLAEEETHTVLQSQAELEGLSEELVASAAAAAEQKGLSSCWIVANTRSAVEPFLTFSSRRDLREKVWRRFIQRGDNRDERDNGAIITEILQLRANRARLLGYETHAHWRLQTSMAKTPEATLELMSTVWQAAVTRVQEEVADMQSIASQQPATQQSEDSAAPAVAIKPWDYRFFAEKVRLAKYDLDENEIKPYLQLDNLREAMFWVAGKLFQLKFSEVEGLPVSHRNVRVWEVLRIEGQGQEAHVGLWYFDPYARQGKCSGAWMSSTRDQETFVGTVTPIVTNNENFVSPPAGKPCLLSWDNAVTLFHEFGHGLHGLLSKVAFPSLSGTSVARDFVEFPSQLFEHWLPCSAVLTRFALHIETGEPMPPTLLKKLQQASRFNQGFATVEYLSTALLDMKLHLDPRPSIDPAQFEKETLEQLGMPPQLVMRHRLPHLSHVFSGDSYSAGYYSYLWADALTADAFEAFDETGAPLNPELAKRLESQVLQVGNTVEPAAAYQAFRGRAPAAEALMRKRGFA